MAGAGYYHCAYHVQRASGYTKDGAGQRTKQWGATFLTLRGAPARQVERQILDDAGPATRTDVEIEAAYHPAVAAECRLVDVSDGTAYEIIGVVDPDNGRKRRLTITAARIRT